MADFPSFGDVYLAASDVKATVGKEISAGDGILGEPFGIPGTESMAVPQGAVF